MKNCAQQLLRRGGYFYPGTRDRLSHDTFSKEVAKLLRSRFRSFLARHRFIFISRRDSARGRVERSDTAATFGRFRTRERNAVGRNYPPPPPRASLIGWLVIIKRDDNKSKGELNSRSDVELSFVRSAYRRGRKFRVNCCTLYAKRGPRARYRERSLERVMARSPPPSCETSNRLSPFQRATYLVPAD